MIKITFTDAQAEWIDWALEGMEGNGLYSDAEELSLEEDKSLEEAEEICKYFQELYDSWDRKKCTIEFLIPVNEYVIRDALYYLEESAPSVSGNDATSEQQAAARARSAYNAAEKIRKEVPGAQELRPLGI